MPSKKFTTAFKLHTLGYSMIPAKANKAPLVQWQQYQSNPANDEQLLSWEKELTPALWGIVTNDKIAVIDADTIEEREALTREMGQPHVGTPRGGSHWYINTTGHPLKTVAGILPHIDVRGVGGFVVISGGKYTIYKLPAPDTLIPYNKLPQRLLTALNGSKPGTMKERGKPIPDGQRNATLTKIAGAMRRQGADQTAIEAALINTSCETPLPEAEIRAIAASVSRYEPDTGEATPTHFNFTDYGNAERLVKQFSGKMRFNPERGLWLMWNGKYWEWDRGNIRVAQLAKRATRNIYHEAGDELDDKARAKLVKHATESERQARIDSMIKSAESEPGVSVLLSELDSNHFLFNANNCTINLLDMTTKRHDPEDMITKIVPTDYDPDAVCPAWDKFIDDITCHDDDLALYLKTMAGVCLTGDMTDQIFFFLFGLGQNGKSTLTDKLLEITGDYGMRVDSEMFMQAEKGKGSATEAVANIRGKRLIVSSEVPEGKKLNTGLLKDLSGGGEAIRARRLYEHEVEFRPTCKIIMFGNYKPTITESTLALWRRLKLIPFNYTVADNDRDMLLGNKLSKELPGILTWAVQGCATWHVTRFLDEPEAVSTAIREYRSDEDLIGEFLSDRCELGEGISVSQSELKRAYKVWCEENSLMPLGPKKFGSRLVEKHCRKDHVKNQRSWIGVALKQGFLS